MSTVNKYIYHSLHKNGSNKYISDGLDIAFCVFDKKCMVLEFSGTNRPLIIIRDNEIIEIKGEKIALGTELSISRRIKKHRKKLEKNDSLYMFTDGYADQFGGPFGKKMKYKNFKQNLLNIQNQSMNEQGKILNETIQNWMLGKTNQDHKYDQVDDILLLGIRI